MIVLTKSARIQNPEKIPCIFWMKNTNTMTDCIYQINWKKRVDRLWIWTPVLSKIADNPGVKYPQGYENTQDTAVTILEFKGNVYAGTFSIWNDILQGLIRGTPDP